MSETLVASSSISMAAGHVACTEAHIQEVPEDHRLADKMSRYLLVEQQNRNDIEDRQIVAGRDLRDPLAVNAWMRYISAAAEFQAIE